MTITPATLYWITRLDGINIMCSMSAFIGFFVIGITTAIYFTASVDTYSDEAPAITKVCKRIIKIFITPWIIALLGLLFVPSSKEMAMIYVVPNITESQVVKQDIPEIYDLGVKALKDWLKKETKEETKGE